MRKIVLAAVLAMSTAAFAQQKPAVTSAGDVKTLLYVGNSFFYFNDSMHSIVLRLVAAGDRQGLSAPELR